MLLSYKLNKVYSHPGWDDTYGFTKWMERTNLGVPFSYNGEYRVNVSMKEGKRRRLRRMVVSFEYEGCGDPFCCGDRYRIKFRLNSQT